MFAGFLTPITICTMMRAVGKKVYPVKIIAIYGYSYFIYLIATVLLLIPNEVGRD